MKAIWNGQIIAESNQTLEVDGNCYFPPDSIRMEYLNQSDTYTTCNIKGRAFYYHLTVKGQINFDAAWYYPVPYSQTKNIANYIAFWKGVEFES
ncbi:MAG: DUF427 domain-containing protein [Salinivirgaceae bacterium]|jgi:uncharacterized protein (DUF427 family)